MYFSYQSDSRRELLATAVFDLIKMECDCELEGAIDQDHLLCDQSQLNKTVFRAEIVTYQLTSDELRIIIENMVTAGRLMVNESTAITLDNSCPVEISSFNDPPCIVKIPDNEQASVEESETQTNSSHIGIIIGSIMAVVAVILLLIAVLLVVMYWKTKHR